VRSIIYIFLITLFFAKHSVSQLTFNGTWKGVSYSKNVSDTSAQIIYLSNSKYKNLLEALVRFEIPGTLKYSTFKLTGSLKDSTLIFDKTIIDKRNSSEFMSDKLIVKLNYIDSTGYLEGQIVRASDNFVLSKLILFYSEGNINNQEQKEVNHSWFFQFKKEFSLGMVAPALREQERKNFKFQSVYFDSKEWILKDEYQNYLKRLIKVVNGHTDLRVKVIGHTDWNGSDQYNEDLSKKRAESIILFLEKNGLSRDRLEYEYQGEKKPIDTNETPDGRKHNRRVDFEFI
jgi:outer membrane protein OmpA-like peptidoglycan-associated protein